MPYQLEGASSLTFFLWNDYDFCFLVHCLTCSFCWVSQHWTGLLFVTVAFCFPPINFNFHIDKLSYLWPWPFYLNQSSFFSSFQARHQQNKTLNLCKTDVKKMGHLPFLADLENRSNLQLTGSMKKSSILNKVWSIISDNTNCITHFIHTNIFLDSDMLKLLFGRAILSFLFQAKSLSCGFRCLSIFSYGNLHFTKRHCCLRSVS